MSEHLKWFYGKHCVECGRDDGPFEGAICSECRAARNAISDSGTADYMAELGNHVHGILAEFYEDLTPFAVGHILSEALFQIAADVRAGKKVKLEYVGTLRRLHYCQCSSVHFTPDRNLSQTPKSTEKRAVKEAS